jgi:restriction system protein
MPRRSNNLLESLVNLPWWFLVVLAFIFPALAGNNMFAASFTKGLAQVAPYGFFLFLIPVPFSLLNSRRKRKQLDAQKDIDSIRDLSWQQFEELVGEAYRRQGYRVVENDSAGPDGGVDLLLYKNGARFLVQCKHWKIKKIGVKTIREIFGLISAEKATGGIVITSGDYTRDALEFARGKALELVNGKELAGLVESVQRNPHGRSEPVKKSNSQKQTPASPSCPKCGSAMVLRTARRGKTVGQQFWGCPNYPKCRATKKLHG